MRNCNFNYLRVAYDIQKMHRNMADCEKTNYIQEDKMWIIKIYEYQWTLTDIFQHIIIPAPEKFQLDDS